MVLPGSEAVRSTVSQFRQLHLSAGATYAERRALREQVSVLESARAT